MTIVEEEESKSRKEMKYESNNNTEHNNINNNNHSKNGTSNGHSKEENGKTEGGLNKQEMLRIIIQSLHQMGMSKSAKLLEEESGLELKDPSLITFFDSIENGKWEDAKSFFSKIEFKSEKDKKDANRLLFTQIFMELLDEGKVDEAFQVLRKDLNPVEEEDYDESIQKLPLLLLCTNQKQLREKGEWNGTGSETRSVLSQNIRNNLSPRYLMKEKRLEELLKQSLQYQVSNCLYHNTSDSIESNSLYHDHQCSKSELPTKCIKILKCHTDEVWYLEFSHNGKRLASCSKDSSIIIWDEDHFNNDSSQNKSPLSKEMILRGHTGGISRIAWSPDDSKLISCGTDFEVKIWDTENGEIIKAIDLHSNVVNTCCWHPDGNRFITGGDDKVVYLHDLESGEEPLRMWKINRITDLAILKNDKIVMLSEKKILITDINSDSTSFTILKDSWPVTSLELSKDGINLLVRNIPSEDLHLWNLEEQRITKRYPMDKKQSRIIIHPCFGGSNESFVVSGNEDSTIDIWHRERESHLLTLKGHTAVVNAVKWNPNHRKMLASCSDDGTVRIWG
eukprot:TRINITY_DN6713_c0_g1_i6.p1 TRINITY_DN6713_c0_g1~~TRINITY_DN6713_c0_g1_i6.p1  ORF type:complete len:564 (+),score=180.23 TRINITY_DN6713_c0_g1_i6:331-2022(+)